MTFLIPLFFLLLTESGYTQAPELIQNCQKQDLSACEKLGDYYFEKSDWENSYLISEALCKKDITRSCMIAGSSQLALGKIKEGYALLSEACDKFEPLACRSVARLMDKAGDKVLARMYFKRACFYGHSQLCGEIRDAKIPFSKAALNFITSLSKTCQDAQSKECTHHFEVIKSCESPLAKQDCQLLAGYLSIYFRSKMLQAEAKLALLSLHASQKNLKDSSAGSGFSYNLEVVLKDEKPVSKYHYVFGFMQGCGKKYLKGKGYKTYSLEIYPQSYKEMSARKRANILAYFSKGKGEDCYDPKSGYEAYAVGSLDPFHPTHLDVWRIDQDQRLVHVIDGLPLP